MSLVPKRPNFPSNQKTVQDIQMELLRTGVCRVYGLGTFRLVDVEEDKKFNWLTDRFKIIPAHKAVEFEMDHRLKTLMNGQPSKLANHYVPPRQLGV